jgi:ubiquinone/menaquinone biosynthesis C-methylase UbiE
MTDEQMGDDLPLQYATKYNSRNPISRRLIGRFLDTIELALEYTGASHVLELGCGEGVVHRRLRSALPSAVFVGGDVHLPSLRIATQIAPDASLCASDAYHPPFSNGAFDLVVMTEVLEHIAEPDRVLAQVQRITRRYVLLSVPREPIFRILNVVRGAYWRDFGNTPTHVQHWSAQGFANLISSYFRIVETWRPLPWTVILAQRARPVE